MNTKTIAAALICAASMAMSDACAAQKYEANSIQQCSTWVEPVLRVEFPEKIDGLTMLDRRTFTESGDDDYALVYSSGEDPTLGGNGRLLSLFIFMRDDPILPDGVGGEVRRELAKACHEIEQIRHNFKWLGRSEEGVLERSKLPFLWTSLTFDANDAPAKCLSLTFITAWRGRFVKIRYSRLAESANVLPCEAPPTDFKSILDAVDALFAEAIEAANVDVYAIEDASEALAALRRKWRGADVRVPMSEMPDYAEDFFELERAQDWCSEDIGGRAEVFERVAREGIRLRIAPPRWFYNLACALARQGRADEAIEALEQAIAAGYNEADYMMEDEDLAGIRGDARFDRLVSIAGEIKEQWDEPRKHARIADGVLALDDDNVYYEFGEATSPIGGEYLVSVDTDEDARPVLLLNYDWGSRVQPPLGMTAVSFSDSLRKAGHDKRKTIFRFRDTRREEHIPTVATGDCPGEDNRLNRPMGTAAIIALDRGGACREVWRHGLRNMLGFYAAGSDYGADGIDRFMANLPVCVGVSSGADDASKFAGLFRDIVVALPTNFANRASLAALNIIRHAQRCVTNEAAFMDGVAQRPVLSFADIDVGRALADARAMTNALPPYMPFIKVSLPFDTSPAANIDFGDDSGKYVARSAHHFAIQAFWAAKTAIMEVEAQRLPEPDGLFNENNTGGEFVWKVLQGDADKVRITTQGEDSAHARIEIDWHGAFDAPLPGGATIKSSRVDIGCFFVCNGRASVPAIASVYFNPNETREYDAQGRLAVSDFTKRQIGGFCPWRCAKGTWIDSFHYGNDGELIGWTRVTPASNGNASTNEFTREGFIIDSRDELGRPLEGHQSMEAFWTQELDAEDLTNGLANAKIGYYGHQYDLTEEDPSRSTLAWKYEYKSDADLVGEPSIKPPRPFRYRPELCLRADFSMESGFALPLIDQMMLGYYRHVGYRHDTLDWRKYVNELLREDSHVALRQKGLVPPETLKRMVFCPWKPAANDLWELDMDDYEAESGALLAELADGVYRLHIPADKGGDKEECYICVRDTYWTQNCLAEEYAYDKLDGAYQRCGEKEIKELLSPVLGYDYWDETVISEDKPIQYGDLPEGVERAIAMWQISQDIRFVILARHSDDFGPRKYFFLRKTAGSDGIAQMFFFSELPSRAIGNTVLNAMADDAEALNNLAVLLYAEIANPGEYHEATVLEMLNRSAEKGNAMAKRNLSILRENKGEMATVE
ncbi:MAG: bacterial transcriptional activator domain-containing protein [Kiritimatiellae bacterium]|nr:bacterial transcriptional activator domain-containing protein [Kiritimatiellia bacterium]